MHLRSQVADNGLNSMLRGSGCQKVSERSDQVFSIGLSGRPLFVV
jgi:hypothetical protein